MNAKKFLPLLFLLLLSTPALAAVAPTINAPTTGSVYNNLPGNLRTIDINFTIGDNNAAVQDLNISIYYMRNDTVTKVYIVQDGNLWDWNANPTGTRACYLNGWNNGTCNYNWAMPNNTVMPIGTYFVDVNITDTTNGDVTPGGHNNADGNTQISISINNKTGYGDAIRSLIGVAWIALTAVILIGGLMGIMYLKTDIGTTVTVMVVSAVIVAIGAVIAATVLVPI